jgi:hypothetical protein
MDSPFYSPTAPEIDGGSAPMADPRLQPTPDYGTLGPGSDITAGAAAAPQPRCGAGGGAGIAIMVGVMLAGLLTSIAHMRRSGFATPFSVDRDEIEHTPASVKDLQRLDQMKPQRQAEALLELAVARNDVAVEQISSRADRWPGKIRWNQQISNLSTIALNSTDMRVRESGIEVELAAYGLRKDSKSLDYVLQWVDSSDHSYKMWALWSLGLLANRGVEPERVVQSLAMHLKDPDEDSRRWTVEGLALTGADGAIPLLLQAMHDDSSPKVRERAACGVAESGMFTPEQRRGVIPQLLIYTDDPALDVQTHNWVFQALGQITHQHLPNNSAAWRNWYENQVASGQ